MVIIMKSSNNKGFALIILIIAMTLIAVLGASFVSMIGSKQQGFTFILNGHRANMIARAGVEWAIRYVPDGLSDTTNTYYTNLPAQPATNKSFAGGTFSVGWNCDILNIANDYIVVTGLYQGVTETITLSNFRRYLNPITLVPDLSQKPRISGNQFVVPVVGNNNADVTVSQIDITIPADRYLQKIQLVNSIETVTVFDYNDSTYFSTRPCGPNPKPCKEPEQGISFTSFIQFDESKGLQQHAVRFDKVNTYYIQFATPPPASCTMKLYPTPWVSEIKFTP
jgi:hypothetical protein